MQLGSFKELTVWQRSMQLVKEVYLLTAELPLDERFGLTTQMRRSAISIPSNIAEGYRRSELGEYIRFLMIADGSAAELETQMLITQDMYTQLDFTKVERLLMEVQRMLGALIQTLQMKKITAPGTLHPAP